MNKLYKQQSPYLAFDQLICKPPKTVLCCCGNEVARIRQYQKDPVTVESGCISTVKIGPNRYGTSKYIDWTSILGTYISVPTKYQAFFNRNVTTVTRAMQPLMVLYQEDGNFKTHRNCWDGAFHGIYPLILADHKFRFRFGSVRFR